MERQPPYGARECFTRVSRPLQPGIRFFPPPNPARHQHALWLACLLRGDGTGFPRSAKLITMDDLGVSWTPVVLQFRAGS